MEVKTLDKVLGSGAEGVVYYYEGYAIKVFSAIDQNKINKINILKEINLDSFVMPYEFVTQDNEIIGYAMKYVEVSQYKTIHHLISSKDTLKEKIEILQEYEDLFKKAHENELLIIDMNPNNFLIDRNYNIKAIDTDNYYVRDIPNSINPLYFYRYYTSKISKIIDVNFDKFQFFMFGIDYLLRYKMDDNRLLFYRKGFTYLEDFIDDLIIPRDIKDIFLLNASNEINKEYIGDCLEELKTSKQKYIRSKRER